MSISPPSQRLTVDRFTINDVGRGAVFLAKLGELPVHVLIFARPARAMLRVEDVVLGIVGNAVL